MHILLGLIQAVLRAFVTALLLLFSTALTAVLGVAAIVFVVLILTGTISFGLSRREGKGTRKQPTDKAP